MTRSLLLTVLGLSALVSAPVAGRAAEADDELAQVLKKAGAWESYRLTTEEQPDPRAGKPLAASYQKGQPTACKADGIEFFRKADVIIYREGDRWQRSRTGTLSDPLRILGAVAKVRAIRLPHEEATALARAVGTVKKEKDGKQHVYSSDLSAEAARALARPEHRGVAQGGSVRFWVDDRGKLVKYTITLRLQGRIGNAEIDGTTTRAVAVSDIGSTEVKVPEAARKALE